MCIIAFILVEACIEANLEDLLALAPCVCEMWLCKSLAHDGTLWERLFLLPQRHAHPYAFNLQNKLIVLRSLGMFVVPSRVTLCMD